MSKSFAEAILTAEQISTKREKHEALSGLDADGVRLLLETEDPFRVFGIKKWDQPEVYGNLDGRCGTFKLFFELLDQLHDRVLTGNAAKIAVTSVLSQYTEDTATVLSRVLKKDLKCGANTNTFETVYPQLKVPHFDLMLCGKIEHLKNDKGEIVYPKYNWTFPKLAEVKYDGMRLVALVENGVVEYLSRSGKPADQWQGLFDEELIAMEKEVGHPIIVDGEALSIEGFAATAKAKGSKNDKSNMRFFAFDWMSLDSWKAQECLESQEWRSTSLDLIIKKLNLTKIVKSTFKILNNLAEATAFYTEVIELGLPGQDEGLIIKDLKGKYEWNSKKRTLTWAKWKPVIDVDVTIVGCYEGHKGTKNEGRLGGFYVEGEDENGNKIKSKCGGFKVNSKKFKDWIAVFAKANGINLQAIYDGGVSKDEFFRKYAWTHQDKFIGQVCMIETQELSKAQNSETYALRFPQFMMLRTDK
jgi:DNA ligase-1